MHIGPVAIAIPYAPLKLDTKIARGATGLCLRVLLADRHGLLYIMKFSKTSAGSLSRTGRIIDEAPFLPERDLLNGKILPAPVFLLSAFLDRHLIERFATGRQLGIARLEPIGLKHIGENICVGIVRQ
jgi:hypothetical protein